MSLCFFSSPRMALAVCPAGTPFLAVYDACRAPSHGALHAQFPPTFAMSRCLRCRTKGPCTCDVCFNFGISDLLVPLSILNPCNLPSFVQKLANPPPPTFSADVIFVHAPKRRRSIMLHDSGYARQHLRNTPSSSQKSIPHSSLLSYL